MGSTVESTPLDAGLLKEVSSIMGVSGITLTNPLGELLHTSIEDEQLNEFIAFLSGALPTLEEALGLGSIHHILLKSPQNSNLGLFACQGQALGMVSRPKSSLHGIAQQIESLISVARVSIHG
jgi:hypothetical protein